MRDTETPISELKGCMELLPQVLKNIHVPAKVPLEKLPRLNQLIKEYEAEIGRNGRILFRYSGTENLARIMVEGEDHVVIDKMAQDLAECAKSSIIAFQEEV
jgi:phosphoglucosamine mutase